MDKPFSCFSPRKQGKDGYQSYCKSCYSARRREYVAANPEKAAYSTAKYRLRNPEKVKEGKARYREENKDKLREYRKASYERNKEKELSSARAYKKAKPEIMRAIEAKRIAKKRTATPAWADDAEIKRFYADAAEFTELTGYQWHVDHIVPLKSELVCGLHWHGNMQVIPASQNQSKSNRHWPDMP